MSSTIPSPIGPATTTRRGTMSADDKTKLDAITGTNTGDVTVSSPAGWLSLAGQALTFALVAATDLVAGVVSIGAQTFAGVKTFANGLIASAAVVINSSLRVTGAPITSGSLTDGQSAWVGSYNNNIGSSALWLGSAAPGTLDYAVAYSSSGGLGTPLGTTLSGTGNNPVNMMARNGTGASDVAVKIGVSTADGSVNASAKLLTVRTGIGGTEIERVYVNKSSLNLVGAISSSRFGLEERTGGASSQMAFRVAALTPMAFDLSSGSIWFHYNTRWFNVAGSVEIARIDNNGQLLQWGTDSTGSPGAATIAKPIGKSAIALGASSVVITNTLVSATSHCIITPHARDATCKELIAVCTANTITVSGSANATAALPFSWEIKTLL